MKKQRIGYLDVARGIAMISIALGHLRVDSINHVVYTYHLPIFFLISGYFFDTKTGFLAFTKKKARQLLVPYYATCLLFLVASSLTNMLYHDAWNKNFMERVIACLYAAGDTWYKPFYIKNIGMIWFLWALFWASIMLKGLLRLKPVKRVAAVAAIFALCCWSRRFIWLPLSIQAGGCALLFVYIGYLIRQLLPRLKQLSFEPEVKVAGVALTFAVWLWFVLTFTSFWLVHCDIGNGMGDIVGSLCGCLILVLLSRFIEAHSRLLTRPLAFYGRYSLLFLSLHLLEVKCIRYKTLFAKFLSLTGLAESAGLFLGFKIVIRLTLITALMLLLCRVPIVRRLIGYEPLRANKEADSDA